jgi:acyl-CoA synthetase (AMP-forming)/AMP-acid ligase II
MKTIIERNTRLYGDKTAFVFEGKAMTFNEFNQRVSRLIDALTKLGMKKGDRVGILAFNSPRFFEVFCVIKAGFICVPLNYRSVGRELAYFLNNSEIKTLILEEAFRKAVNEIRADLTTVENFVCLDGAVDGTLDYEKMLADASPQEPAVPVGADDEAILFYTSGTTGLPKGSVHTQRSVAAETLTTHRQISDEDTTLCVMPFFHVGGTLAYMFPSYAAGAKTIIQRKFDTKQILATIQEEKVTNVCFVPVMLARLMEDPDFDQYDLSSLRTIVYTGAPMPAETLRKGLDTFGNLFIQVLGQTETNLMTVLDKEEHARGFADQESKVLTSVGRPYKDGELKIIDGRGREVPVGEVGEIVANSDRNMNGYWKQPEETAKTIKDGWLYTGDMARRDENGYIYLVDRSKDMIISGGENIYSREVEQALETHPAVAEAAVIGVPDEKWGEAVKAVVVLKNGEKLTETELIDHCKGRLASYKKPSTVDFWDELPKNPSGKVLKKQIREKYWEGRERRIN